MRVRPEPTKGKPGPPLLRVYGRSVQEENAAKTKKGHGNKDYGKSQIATNPNSGTWAVV